MMHSVGETTFVCKCSDDWVNIWIRGLDLSVLTKRKNVVVEYKTTVISSEPGNHCTAESKATNKRNAAAKRFAHGDIALGFHRQLVILYFDRRCN